MLCPAFLGWQVWQDDPPLRVSCGEDPWGRRGALRKCECSELHASDCRLDGKVHLTREVATVRLPYWYPTGSLATCVLALCVGDAPAELGPGPVSLASAPSQLQHRPGAAFSA